MILQHEADRLGLPADKELAIRWLQSLPRTPMTTERFQQIYHQHNFSNEVTDVQLLEEIANQLRLRQVQMLPGDPVITPLDLYQTYRDQNERVSVYALPFPVEDYVKEVPAPSEAELAAFFEKHKNLLPDRTSATPGFKIPQRVQVEYIMADPAARTQQIEAQLTEKEVREIFAARPGDFPVPPPELPANLFADDAQGKLTPSKRDPFLEVRDTVARTVARERAQEEVDKAFGQIQDNVIRPFSDKYGAVLDANKEAKDEGKAPQPLPQAGETLKTAAEKTPGLHFGRTPPLDRQSAATAADIGSTHHGGGLEGGGTSFVEEFFDPHHPLYEESELTDDLGRRFLVWKIADYPGGCPP